MVLMCVVLWFIVRIFILIMENMFFLVCFIYVCDVDVVSLLFNFLCWVVGCILVLSEEEVGM